MARPNGPGSRPSGHAPTDREASPVDPSRTPALTVEQLAEMDALSAAASPGRWGIYEQGIRDQRDPIRELTDQVWATKPLGDYLYLLEADGKCPATTGCGLLSEANAKFIASLVNGYRSGHLRPAIAADSPEGSTEAIAGGLMDVAGWLENEGWIPKHVSQIRSGAQRLRELSTIVWFPIETAPKDGTPVDLWDGDGRRTDCFWREDRWCQPIPTRGRVPRTVSGFVPTHWMPLPPAPCDEPPKGEDAPSAAEERSSASAVGESRGAHE